jgi:thiamine kinase-like enzyme
MDDSILSAYGLDDRNCSITVFGNGLINQTWKITCAGKEWILQKINHQIFRHPPDIMDNCRLLSAYFKINHPDYLFVAPVNTDRGQNFICQPKNENNYYRLFHFIKNSYSCNEVSSPAMACEAAKQFGKFTRLLSAFNPAQLHITLPDFHNLTLRYEQFLSATLQGNHRRVAQSAENISFLKTQFGIVETFEKIRDHSSFKLRVIHHDTKISNILFDRNHNKGLCVIDLDTVMSGFYISDVGDMLRTYLSPVSEEEQDFSRIEIREEFFHEVMTGYLGEMFTELNEEEKQYFVYAGQFAIYMQALRFLTDYLNDDSYYRTQYEDQNLVRAGNQIVLLKKYTKKEARLNEIVKSFA